MLNGFSHSAPADTTEAIPIIGIISFPQEGRGAK